MELIETQLSEFTRRSRSLAVRHTATRLDRGLEYGERVLVRSGHEYRTAVVADIDFTADDTHYRLVLGGAVSLDFAENNLLGEINLASPGCSGNGQDRADRVTIEDVAVLLTRAASGPRIPLQRRAARRLLDR